MIEGMAVLGVFAVATLIYFSAFIQAQNEQGDATTELARLQETLAWHDERLRLARVKRWDDEMINRIVRQRAEVAGEIVRRNQGL